MKTLSIIFLFILSLNISAKDNTGLTVVAVGKAELEKDKIVILNPLPGSNINFLQKKIINDFVGILRNDFSFYKKHFQIVSAESFSGSPDYSDWTKKQARFVIRSSFQNNDVSLGYRVELFDIRQKSQLFDQSGNVDLKNFRSQTHQTADGLYQKITGKESIFTSKIIFVSDKTSKSRTDVRKELYMMDFDGRGTKALTSHGGIVSSPAISPDGTKVLYSLILPLKKKRQRNVDLYLLDLETGSRRRISNKKGINSGAVFMPDGKSIILTLSHTGNAEIFSMNLETRALKRLTRHFAPDVDPSISVDGSLMAFLSGRAGAGKPMIYVMDPTSEEKSVRRISYVGQFNATPRFSPDGKEIVFSSWLDNRFDIFRINAKGSDLSRLTKDFGSNENPTYSNDGQFIAFSSQRVISRTKAVNNLYIMDRDGEILGQVTRNFGNCTSPRWSK